VAPRIGYAGEALALRRGAIRLLTNITDGTELLAAGGAGFSDAAWRLFLHIEQCASELRTCLGEREIPPVLHQFATIDLQQSLSARAQLATLAAIAREREWPLVVLKGSVAASEGRPIHLLDVDVLARPEHAEALVDELARRANLRFERYAAPRHLAPMAAPFSVPVEIHLSIDSRWTRLTGPAWSRIVPLDGAPGLFRLAPRDHLLHMLSHVVVDHPDRRGRLRDAILLRQALGECSAPDLDDLAREIAGSVYATELSQQLEFIRGMAAGDPNSDRYEKAAFAHFWLSERMQRGSREQIPLWRQIYGTVWIWAMSLVAGWRVRQWLLDGLHTPSADLSRFPVTAWLERRAPRAGRALRVCLRAIHYLLAGAFAWPMAIAARRAAKRAGAR
jgi:hypothetical protein